MNRTFALLLCLIAVVAGWVVYTRVSPEPPSASVSLAPKVEGSKIYFVPMGDFPVEQLQNLAQYYHEKYGIEITIVNSVPVDPICRDASRQQLMAESLAASLRRSIPEHGGEPGSILIGFTAEDIYPTTRNWQFAFGWRLGDSGPAVVSSARLSLILGRRWSGICRVNDCGKSSPKTSGFSTTDCRRARIRKACSTIRSWELKNSTRWARTSDRGFLRAAGGAPTRLPIPGPAAALRPALLFLTAQRRPYISANRFAPWPPESTASCLLFAGCSGARG